MPASVSDALSRRKARLEQMTMLFLHRVSITLVRRWFVRNPSLLERTTETIIWSASFPKNESHFLSMTPDIKNKP